jgi:autotransporter-associated beta strand protein
MKPKGFVKSLLGNSLTLTLSTVLVIGMLPHSAQAGTLSWDADAIFNNGTLGGTGTWDTSLLNWDDGAQDTSWATNTITGDTALFAGTAGTVTLDTAINALGLQFTTTGYTLATGANTLTLGTGGIDASTLSSGTTTISGLVALGASQSWNVGSGATLATSAAISGSGFGITKTGAGTLSLSGSNTYSGATAISAGTLIFQGSSAMSTSSALSMSNGATLGLRADADTTFTPASFSNLTAGSTYNISVASLSGSATGKTLSLIAPSGGGGGTSATTLNVSGTSGEGYTLRFTSAFATNSNNGSAWTTASNNIINLTNADVVLNAGMSMGANGNGGITVNSSTGNTLTINGNVATNTNRTSNAIVNSGTLTLNNTVSLGGTNQGFWVTLNGGTLNVNNAGAIRNNSVISGTRAGLAITGGTLNNTSGSAITLTYNPTVLLNGNFAFGTSGSTSANNLNLGTGAASLGPNSGTSRTITVNGSTTLTMGGAIANGTTANALVKDGTGTLALNGASTYTGATTINGGTLALGAAGSISSSGVSLGTSGTFDVSAKGGSGYTVNNLSGSGTVTGSLTVSTQLAIGNSPGTVTFTGDLTLGSGSTYLYEMVGGGTSADLGDVAGNLTLTGSILDLVQLGTYTDGDKFTLFAYDGALTGTFDGLADDSTFTDAGGEWRIDYNDTTAGLNGGVSASNTYVTITAVPEPGAALLGGLSVLALLRRRRAA